MARLLFAALLLAAAPLAVHAQDLDLDRAPSVGKIFNGEVPEGGGTARYLLTLQAGQAIDLTATPVSGSDPVVRVYDAASDTLIAENDDSAGGLAANVRLFSEQRKRVRIEVANASVEDSLAAMRFDLILRPTDYRPNPVLPLAIGDTHAGTLASGDEQLFRFQGKRGELWNLAMTAAAGSSLDPALAVYGGDIPSGEVLGEDDDGGGGINSRLRFLVPQDGTYTVRAHGVDGNGGDYTLSAGRVDSAAMAVRDIDLGAPATAALDGNVGEHLYRLSDGARSALAAGAGPLIVELSRTGEASEGALDPILEIGFDTPLGFSSLLQDDDGGGDMNARLVFDGTDLAGPWLEALRFKARSYDNTTGDYALTVTRAGD